MDFSEYTITELNFLADKYSWSDKDEPKFLIVINEIHNASGK